MRRAARIYTNDRPWERIAAAPLPVLRFHEIDDNDLALLSPPKQEEERNLGGRPPLSPSGRPSFSSGAQP